MDGWLNKQKRVNTNPTRIWIFNPDSEKGVTEAKKSDSNSLQKAYHPPKKEIKSPDISTAAEQPEEPEIQNKVVNGLTNILFWFLG